MNLNGKVAVVTGGSRGIGRAISERLAKDGALVVINYRTDAESAASVVSAIEGAGGEAFALAADVTSVAAVARFFESVDVELKRRRGDHRFDILINNAGVALTARTEQTSEVDFDRVIATNLKGPFFVAQHAIPRLRDGGRLINVSSGLSQRPRPEYAAYSMTKGGINTFTVALAADLGARKITVNTLSPGLTATDLNAAVRALPGFEQAAAAMTALGRVGRVEDIADAAAMIASDDAGWITGQYIEASGGLGLVMPVPKRD